MISTVLYIKHNHFATVHPEIIKSSKKDMKTRMEYIRHGNTNIKSLLFTIILECNKDKWEMSEDIESKKKIDDVEPAKIGIDITLLLLDIIITINALIFVCELYQDYIKKEYSQIHIFEIFLQCWVLILGYYFGKYFYHNWVDEVRLSQYSRLCSSISRLITIIQTYSVVYTLIREKHGDNDFSICILCVMSAYYFLLDLPEGCPDYANIIQPMRSCPLSTIHVLLHVAIVLCSLFLTIFRGGNVLNGPSRLFMCVLIFNSVWLTVCSIKFKSNMFFKTSATLMTIFQIICCIIVLRLMTMSDVIDSWKKVVL